MFNEQTKLSGNMLAQKGEAIVENEGLTTDCGHPRRTTMNKVSQDAVV